MDHAPYDKRRYPIVEVREGYGEWAPGESITIRSHVHLMSDHVKAARAAGWILREMDEGLVNDDWTRKKPNWEAAYGGLPVSFAMVWRREPR